MSLSQALNQFAQNLGRYLHIASMEFLECFSYSRLLIINNRALAG